MIFDHDFPCEFEEILKLYREVIESQSGKDSFIPLIRYVFSTRDDLSVKDIADMVNKYISKEKGDEIMIIAEKFRKKGNARFENFISA